jgi:hypothetical protein
VNLKDIIAKKLVGKKIKLFVFLNFPWPPFMEEAQIFELISLGKLSPLEKNHLNEINKFF